jgi:hypothetical protein
MAEAKKEIQLEIGHVLFIDIVGYSKLLINEQSEQIERLGNIVRGTEQVRLADAEGKVLLLPTGDGGALVFRNSLEAPAKCALEISRALKNYPALRVRMGIHSGPVNEITDLNEQANIAGAGINIAQRVMDCGDAGHILLSKLLPMTWSNTHTGAQYSMTWVNTKRNTAFDCTSSTSAVGLLVRRRCRPGFQRNEPKSIPWPSCRLSTSASPKTRSIFVTA